MAAVFINIKKPGRCLGLAFYQQKYVSKRDLVLGLQIASVMKYTISAVLFLSLFSIEFVAWAQDSKAPSENDQKVATPVTDLRSVTIDMKQWLVNRDLNKVDFQKKIDSLLKQSSMDGVRKRMELNKKDNGGWGGGTGVLRVGQAPLLYDLYMSHPDLQDTHTIKPFLPATTFLKRAGFERIAIEQLPEYTATLQLLETWRASAPALVFLLEVSLKNLNLSYTELPLQRIDGLVLVAPVRAGESLEPLIVFNEEIGARINKPLWELHGDRSRMGALIHEALRNYQIVQNYHHQEPHFDAKIQKLTNFLIMQDPRDLRGSLNYSLFFDQQVLSDLEHLEVNFLSLRDYVELLSPHHIADPKRRANFEKNLKDPATIRDWEEKQEKFLQEWDPFKRNADIKKILVTLEKASFQRLEESMRNYVQNGTSLSPSERFVKETELKGFKLLNNYLQSRWQGHEWSSLWSDLRTLILLQLDNPREDVFAKIEKYQQRLFHNFSMPLDKIQSRDTSKLQEEQDKQKRKRSQWLDGIWQDLEKGLEPKEQNLYPN